MNMTKKVNFQWLGPQVECYNLGLSKGTNVFYKSFSLNNEVYDLGDFAVFNSKPNKPHLGKGKICQIICMHESQDEWNQIAPYRAVVRWHSHPHELKLSGNFDYDKEIIANLDNMTGFVAITHLQKKLNVMFGTDFAELTRSAWLSKDIDFFCRYQLHKGSLELTNGWVKSPAKHQQSTTITEELENCVLTESTPTSLKRKPEVINLCDSEEEIDIVAIKSPAKSARRSSLLATPIRKESVKRNLNESFNNSAPNSQAATPVLNYSIVEDSVSGGSLKIKLRLSGNQDPKVVLTKLEDALLKPYLEELLHIKTPTVDGDNASSETRNETQKVQLRPRTRRISFLVDETESPVRRSTRTVQRKSYSDYISPVKLTPGKRHRKKSTDSVSSTDLEIIGEDPRVLSNSPLKRNRTKIATESFEVHTETPKKKAPEETPEKRPYTPRKPKSTRKSNWSKLQISTPTKSVRYEDDDDVEPKTPKTPRNFKASSTPKNKNTPSAKAKLIREGVITPSLQTRKTAVKDDNTPLTKARVQLHVSYVPTALPCREKEFSDIFGFLQGKLLDGCGGCMYISGVPGTGKTATVTDVIKKLHNSDVPSFKYVNINGMRLTEPRQSYVEILKQLIGKTVAWEQAQTMLGDMFTKPKKKSQPIILLVDELDILCTKRQDVVYNLLDWPTKAVTQLMVITIANTMDLPERLLMGRVTSRLGLTRLTFQPYTHKQLQEIVTKRLIGTNAFNPDAIQLVARKVASVSGDARRALDICRRSAEIAELQGSEILVSMTHVNEALNAMITQPKVQAIKHCSRLEQLIMQAVVAEIERTGIEETTFTDVYAMLLSISTLDGFQMVSCTIALKAVSYLGACRLLLTDTKLNDLDQRIILNVSPDDVYYALRKD